MTRITAQPEDICSRLQARLRVAARAMQTATEWSCRALGMRIAMNIPYMATPQAPATSGDSRLLAA
ncbi:hypothetical protein, partial [Faecalibaculum rodentium]|uniref:hypothetical protein n=1 Tax=Faecalibaculum rodentium TaxID=1702221 RepID=UPI003EBC6506